MKNNFHLELKDVKEIILNTNINSKVDCEFIEDEPDIVHIKYFDNKLVIEVIKEEH